MPKVNVSVEDRFDSFVEVSTTGCWLWKGSVTYKGYGRFSLHGKPVPVHRLAYTRYKGPIDAGLHVCHSCDIRNCVNPDHLFLGTNIDNIRDSVEKGRKLHGVQHHAAKLDNKSVLSIRSKRVTGQTYQSLADEYRVSVRTIRSVIRRIYWKHI